MQEISTGFKKYFDKAGVSVYTISVMSNLCVQKLAKAYGNGTVALSKVSFETGDGGFLTVCGPAGAGKSVLLRVIAGLETADGGELLLDEKALNEHISERDIAMTFPDYELKPNLTVRGNLGYGLKLRKTDPAVIDRTVRDTAEAFGLSDILEKKPKEITLLQQKLAALGRALMRKPRVFLMDGLLAGLGDEEKTLLIIQIKRLKTMLSGTPFLLTTNEPSEAVGLGEKTLLLYSGEVMGFGMPEELLANPQNYFTAAFFTELPVNVFSDAETVKIVRAQDTRVMETGGVCGTVVATEEDLLYIQIEGKNAPLLAYAHMHNYKAGDGVCVTYKDENTFLFNKETGERVG